MSKDIFFFAIRIKYDILGIVKESRGVVNERDSS